MGVRCVFPSDHLRRNDVSNIAGRLNANYNQQKNWLKSNRQKGTFIREHKLFYLLSQDDGLQSKATLRSDKPIHARY